MRVLKREAVTLSWWRSGIISKLYPNTVAPRGKHGAAIELVIDEYVHLMNETKSLDESFRLGEVDEETPDATKDRPTPMCTRLNG